MNDIIDINTLMPSGSSELDIIPTLFNFAVCVVMSFAVRSFYINRSFSLTGKTHIGAILPVLSMIVFIVIVVVKSSLALSLGLVGALSIVRFRTPIKEPEELVYLFLAIAIGLGYGAGHVLITTVLISLTLLMIYLWLSNRHIAKTSEYNLVVNWKDPAVSFEDLAQKIGESAKSLKLVRLDRSPSSNTAVFLISPEEKVNFDTFVTDLQEHDPQTSITFFEAKTNW